MIRKNLRVSLRNLQRQKLLAFIKIIGLSIGVSACLVIFLIADYEMKYDRFQVDRDRIYRVHSQFSGVFSGLNRGVPTGVYTAMKDEFSGIESIANFHTFSASVKVPNTQGVRTDFDRNSKIAFARPEYFDVFNFYDWKIGNPEQSLSEPFQVVLTESKANTYFAGESIENMIGREIHYRDSLVVTVSGIVADVEENTDFYFTDFISYLSAEKSWLEYNANDWNSTNSSCQLFVKLLPEVSLEQFKEQMVRLEEIYKEHNPEGDYYNEPQMQPLTEMHFNSELGIFDNSRSVVDLPTLQMLIIIALLLLVAAVINFVNLETAQASQRSKEVGIRKTLGSSRFGLISYFLVESAILSTIAIVLSVLISWGALNFFDEFIPEGLVLTFTSSLVLFLVSCILVVTLFAGLYPAMVLSSFRPAVALKNQMSNSSTTRSGFIRQLLTVFQFSFSQLLIIITLAIGLQISFMINKDLGFKSDAIVYFYTPWYEKAEKKQLLKNELEKIPEIQKLSMHNSPPSSNGWSSSTMTYLKGDEEIKHSVFRKPGDPSYIDLYGIELIAGENVREDSYKEYLINETYLEALGFDNPHDVLGEVINEEYTVVGVVKDFHTKSLHSDIDPVVISNSEDHSCFGLQLSTDGKKISDVKGTLEKVEAAWKTIYPDRTFNHYFLDETIERFYENEQRSNTLAKTATIISILISCLGLFGLSSFTVIQRTKEVGIRKVLGASVANIVYLLSKNVIILVGIAFLIAAPVAYFLVGMWQEDFVYRVDMGAWVYVAAASISLLVAFVTLSFRSLKAAKADPVDSLRYE